LPVFHIILHFGIIFTHLYLFAIGEKVRRAYISFTSIRFGDSCQRGRKYEPKAKGPHHHRILKMKFFKLISYFAQKGKKIVSSKLAKPS
jgi:hypothetical protein